MNKIFLIIISLCAYVFGNTLDFSLIKKGDNNKTMLVIGGIQGDEPGGFFAANLLATEYNITKGSLWVVPNLNFLSMVYNDRGIRGDMNRKFAKISTKDPDYKAVTEIKKIITAPNVELIVHLHDGSGFYRPWHKDALENPKRWGNCAVIDQEIVEGIRYGDLIGISTQVINAVNANLKNKQHTYHIRNTRTGAYDTTDAEQRNSLTYFAITNGKAAYANEASKNMDVYTRIYYHLVALEEYMRIAGIEFQRNFELDEKSIKAVVEKEIKLNIFGNKFLLTLKSPRDIIKYIPAPNMTLHQDYTADNPLLAMIADENNAQNSRVYYGNRFLTKLQPQYFEYSQDALGAGVKVDGNDEIVLFGSKIQAKNTIEIKGKQGIRVNVIGFETSSKNEADIPISKKEFKKEYSIDKGGKIFRVEFYEVQNKGKDKFLGMFLVEFV